jgi:hypothetical protein
MVFLMDLQVLRQIGNTMCQQPDLNFRRSRIPVMKLVTIHELFFIFGCKCQFFLSSCFTFGCFYFADQVNTQSNPNV